MLGVTEEQEALRGFLSGRNTADRMVEDEVGEAGRSQGM